MDKYVAKKMFVTNNIRTEDQLMWVHAFCSASDASITVFDSRKRLLHFNNLFGTLDRANNDDLLDIYSVFSYYGRFYPNWAECLDLVKRVFYTKKPAEFTMKHLDGWACNCIAYPVLDNGTLGGVVILAHRTEYGSVLPWGKNYGEQCNSRTTKAGSFLDVFGRFLACRAACITRAVVYALSACGGP